MAFDTTKQDGILCIAAHGTVDAKDVARLVEVLLKTEAEPGPTVHRLTDLSAVEDMDLDFGVIQELAAVRMTLPLKNHVKSAIVAPQPLHVGFARMYQTLNSHPDVQVKIFPDRDSAWKWLTTDGV